MANSLQLEGNSVVSGLGTFTYTVLAANRLEVQVKSTIPAGSGLLIVINNNGSPLVSSGGDSTNPTPTQPSLGASTIANFAAADVITVVLSSSNAVDALPNAVKSVISLFQID